MEDEIIKLTHKIVEATIGEEFREMYKGSEDILKRIQIIGSQLSEADNLRTAEDFVNSLSKLIREFHGFLSARHACTRLLCKFRRFEEGEE